MLLILILIRLSIEYRAQHYRCRHIPFRLVSCRILEIDLLQIEHVYVHRRIQELHNNSNNQLLIKIILIDIFAIITYCFQCL
jgi:hypothetical protein